MLKSAGGLIRRCSYRHSNRRSCSGSGETDEGSLTQEHIHPSLQQGTGAKASYLGEKRVWEKCCEGEWLWECGGWEGGVD